MPLFLRISLVLSLFILSACPSRPEVREAKKEPLQERVHHYPLRDEVDTLDPAHTQRNSSQIVLNQLFDGLVRFDKHLNILPGLAESWIISEEGRVYTFFIRKGVRFHNGREVRAEDAAYSIRRAMGDGLLPVSEAVLEGGPFQVEEVRPEGDHTLVIRLKEPYAPTLNVFAMINARIVPREEVEKGSFDRHPVGTGPFRFVSWEGKEIVLEANPEYFEGRPFLDRLVYRLFPGPDDRGIFRAFMAGEVENFTIPLTEDLDTLSSKGFTIVKRPMAKLHIYGFNNTIKPFNINGVREAIYHVIDRERIVREAVDGRVPFANGLIPPGIAGYTPKFKGHRYDPEEARGLLKEAGYPGGEGLPPIDLWTASRSAAANRELDIVRENLSDIGIKVNIRYAPWPRLEEMMKKGELPMFRSTVNLEFPDPEAVLGLLFDSKGVYNYTFYENPEVDRLLEEGRGDMDMLKRIETYRKIEKIVLDDAPLIPVLFYAYEQALQPYVKGFEASALGEIYIQMKKVRFEEVEE
ncbi:MAG: ABC transporter substrate-binding protein [Thermodesulfobacteriota bacterium]